MGKYNIATTPDFEREYYKLKKKYPKIDDDFEDFLDEIEENNDLGDDIAGVIRDGNKIFKKRMKNTSAKKGLSGGFRVIEYLVTGENVVFLLDIYSKSNQEDISNKEIQRMIKKNQSFIKKKIESE
ncbi:MULTISPECIES: type II toxin-antitoxin system RelE/ParE family toxin [Bacillus cereus group]|uniref:type II toxin-antitoxin system RelE/ParE family toxin n=1 Tax=Bacillus cereus group TaxID=86661 RepID=UPI000BED23CB|nr:MULTISPECIES: type II toxin-antitoxin system RelE/ParE family toxin [Bacillus cereus group]PED94921.1 addiction module antitoxin [Bacillus toyonensis]PEL58724.1 addiction module antitoxin [Bacillus toyonensis]PEO73345.1 addiction module antitoxin [Bacillus toyonensis]PGB84104.1 addiction module antitoxin [Bacillus wiedmannii]